MFTQYGRQNDEPRPDVREGFDDLILLEFLILRTSLIVSDTFKCCNPLLLRQHASIDWGIWQPDQDDYANHNRKSPKQNINNLIGRYGLATVE
jgi:hypothetical protein